MPPSISALDAWLRSDFVRINTRLEEAHRQERAAEVVDRSALHELRTTLRREGAARIGQVAADGVLPERAVDRYVLLGMVGYYLAACRRHEIDGEPARGDASTAGDLAPAAIVATRLGASLGVAPRYVFAHQAFYNTAVGGAYRTFTALPEERTFIELNTRAVLAYRRAATALGAVADMGVSSPMARDLFDEGQRALGDVLAANQALARALDVSSFYFHIRPYFKSYRVGRAEYRGANAGDFSAINEIDVTLGVCRMDDPFYQSVVVEKWPYVPPEDQARLRALADRPSLLDALLREAQAMPSAPLIENARRFLAVCKAHGAAYAFHHHRLVKPYLVAPANAEPADVRDDVTASGPPLEVVVAGLARLSDLRVARDLPGLLGAHARLARLRRIVASRAG